MPHKGGGVGRIGGGGEGGVAEGGGAGGGIGGGGFPLSPIYSMTTGGMGATSEDVATMSAGKPPRGKGDALSNRLASPLGGGKGTFTARASGAAAMESSHVRPATGIDFEVDSEVDEDSILRPLLSHTHQQVMEMDLSRGVAPVIGSPGGATDPLVTHALRDLCAGSRAGPDVASLQMSLEAVAAARYATADTPFSTHIKMRAKNHQTLCALEMCFCFIAELSFRLFAVNPKTQTPNPKPTSARATLNQSTNPQPSSFKPELSAPRCRSALASSTGTTPLHNNTPRNNNNNNNSNTYFSGGGGGGGAGGGRGVGVGRAGGGQASLSHSPTTLTPR